MAIFNSYVKLPEGNDEEHSQIRWRLGHLRTAESRAATAAEEKTELQLSLGLSLVSSKSGVHCSHFLICYKAMV